MSDPLDVFEDLARRRRTSLLMDSERAVPDELLDRLLRVTTLAPNHKRTWPWRFAVLTGSARDRLGELVAEYEARSGAEPGRVEKARRKYVRSPVVVLIGSAWQPDPVRRVEDRDAVAAGINNLLLGATAAGLASHWATGTWMGDPAVKAYAGLDAADELVALVYLGWPNGEVAEVARPEPEVIRRR